MHYRFADFKDIPTLAEGAAQLAVDEGLRERPQPAELQRRLWDWLSGEYRAVLFEHGERRVGYALYRNLPDHVELKHFYVQREFRDGELEMEAFEMLRDEVWRPGVRVQVETLADNRRSRDFWSRLGFAEYAVTLELDTSAAQSEAAAAS